MLLRTLLKFQSSTLKSFNSLELLNKHLNETRPAHCVVYFRANWNPQCEQSDQHAARLANENAGIEVIKVDSDAAPKIAKHYGVKSEPEFVYCFMGDQVIRHIGVDYSKLQEKIKKVDNLSKEVDFTNIPSQKKWVPYGTSYKVYYEQYIRQQYEYEVSDF